MIEDHQYATVPEALQASADAMADALSSAVQSRGTAAIAVSGGRTPLALFPMLAKKPVPWGNVTVTLTDERWVSTDHADSNEGLARRYLLEQGAGRAAFIGLKTPDQTPEGGLVACEQALNAVPFPLDVVYLGIGPDGHCASLFPGAPWADAPGRCYPVPATSDRQARMSLTPSALLDSRAIMVVFSGSGKRAVFDEARTPGPAVELPLRVILQQEKVPVHVFSAP